MTPARLVESLARRPMIAAVLLGRTMEADARRARSAGADIVEVRLDSLQQRDLQRIIRLLKRVRQISRLPVITTVRWNREQGPAAGFFSVPDRERIALYQAAMPYSELVDVELRSPIRRQVLHLARKKNKKVILSFHDFKSIPSRSGLQALVRRFKASRGDILKIAATPANEKQAGNFLWSCLMLHPLRRVFIAMGRYGRISRVAGFLFGSALSYGFIRAGAAPGQIPVRQPVRHYREFYPSHR